MPDFTGFEPQVGEVRALRTFRVGPHGWLFPLFSDRAWAEGENTAQCALTLSTGDMAAHCPPEQQCTCGFYGYGSETAAHDYPHSRHVLAVVACWGKIITGTRGIRAEHACLEAIWLSTAVPAGLVREVAARYPGVKIYADTETMLNRHPITAVDSYEVEPAPPPPGRTFGPRLAIGAAMLLGLPPANWVGSSKAAIVLWVLSSGLMLLAAVSTRGARQAMAAKRRRLLIFAATVWLAAPIAGWEGWLLLRIPMLDIVALMALQRLSYVRESRRFPARIGHGRSPADRGGGGRRRPSRGRVSPEDNR